MDVALVAARVVVAAALAWAGVSKSRDREGVERAASDLGLPVGVAALASWALVPVELALAVLLLPASTAWWAAFGAFVVLAVFTALLVGSLSRGERPHCRCFGAASAEPISWWSVVRNAVLLVIVGLVVLIDPVDAGPGAVHLGS